MYDTGRLMTQEALNRNQMIQPRSLTVCRYERDRRSPVDVYNTYNRTPSVADPILSGFKDDLFNLEMENTAYESLKSSLPIWIIR
jgi:hypothetical protein